MIALSKALEEQLWGDAAILRYIQMGKDAFEAGEKDALLGIVFLCARYQAVIPDWAVDALLDIERDLESGALVDINEAFGWQHEHLATRKKRARQRRLRAPVLLELQAARLAGASFNADDICSRVVESLRGKGMKLSRRDVEEIYKEHGTFLKKLPRSPDPNHRYGQMHAILPDHRRAGRAILRD
jgi:hypothetical protein